MAGDDYLREVWRPHADRMRRIAMDDKSEGEPLSHQALRDECSKWRNDTKVWKNALLQEQVQHDALRAAVRDLLPKAEWHENTASSKCTEAVDVKIIKQLMAAHGIEVDDDQ